MDNQAHYKVSPTDLEAELNDWMTEHQTEIFGLISESMEEFREAHPGADEELTRINALSMADRRFMARAIGAVISKYLQ
jgi:hypothetical protein